MENIVENLAGSSDTASWFSVFDELADLVLVIAPNDTLSFFNQAVLTGLAYDRQALQSLVFSDILAPECRLGIKKLLNDLPAGKLLNHVSVILIAANGDHIKYQASFRLIRDLGPRQGHVIAVLRDNSNVMKQQMAYDVIKGQIKFYQEIFNAVPDLFFSKNEQGIYQECNIAMIEFLSKTKDMIIGEVDANILSPEGAKIIKRQEAALLKTGGQVVYQVQLMRGDDRLRDFIVHEALVKDSHGEARYFVGIMTDITDDGLARINLETKVQELEKINKLLVGRELKMIELKEKIRRLQNQVNNNYVAHQPQK